MFIRSRPRACLSAAVLVIAVPLSAVSVHALRPSATSEEPVAVAALDLTAAAVTALLRPQPVAPQTTIAGRL